MVAMPGRYRLTLLVLCTFLRTAFAITVESDFYEYRRDRPDSQVLPSGDDVDTLIDLEQPFPVLGNLHSNLSVRFSSTLY